MYYKYLEVIVTHGDSFNCLTQIVKHYTRIIQTLTCPQIFWNRMDSFGICWIFIHSKKNTEKRKKTINTLKNKH